MRTSVSFLAAWSAALSLACGADIKDQSVSDSGSPGTTDTAADPTDTADTGGGETGAPPTGDVVVTYEVSWVAGPDTLTVCEGELSLTDVDTAHRTWTLWTDLDLELDPASLPATAPANVPVGEDSTVGPGSWRFSVDAATDVDLNDYAAGVAAGGQPVCLLARGTTVVLHAVDLPEAVVLPEAPITAVELRIAVAWTDR